MPLALLTALLLAFAEVATAATFTVTSNLDAGPATLRAAIDLANADSAPDIIDFSIDSGAQTIALQSPLPDVTQPVKIDGTTQPGFSGTPLIEIDGTAAGAGYSGLALIGHTGTTVRGLVINRFADDMGAGGIGILVEGGGGHTIAGNYLGTDATGTLDRGNRTGVFIDLATGCTVGGTTTADRNVISGNAAGGVQVRDSTNDLIRGNWIGLTSSGSVSLGNGSGVFILSSSAPTTGNVVGGNVSGSANVISANGTGVIVANDMASGNTVAGNLIGTDAAGTAVRANNQRGISVNGAPGTTIDANVVAGSSTGIDIHNVGADGTVVTNNKIGTDVGETLDFGNGTGVQVFFSAGGSPNGATIGGAGAGNVIAHSTGTGVSILGGFSGNVAMNTFPVGVEIRENRIFANGGLGIDLHQDGVTANDTLDADDGENHLQNFPVVTGVVDMGDSFEFTGTLAAAANTAYRIELFSSSAANEGAGPLGTTMVTTDGGGDGAFDVMLGVFVGPGELVTATATDPAGNTSELSAAFVVAGATTTSSSTSTTLDPTTTTSTLEDTTTTTSTVPDTTTTTSTVPDTTTTTSTVPDTTTTTSTVPDTTTTTLATTTTTSTTLGSTTTTSTTLGTTTTTSTTIATTTTASSTSTIAPTTTTSSTSTLVTTTSSVEPTTTSAGPTTSLPVTSTTTTTAGPTTTTTLPCDMGFPLPGLVCRINALSIRVGQEAALALLQVKLQKLVGQARTRAESAREMCLIVKSRGAKAQLGKAITLLKQFEKVFRTKKGKMVPAEVRTDILAISGDIRHDMRLVKIGLTCPP